MSEEKTELVSRVILLPECAKLLRAALKREFPDVKFSVRCEHGSGVAQVGVTWCDGPAREQVEAVCDCYDGSRREHIGGGEWGDVSGVVHWLCADGRATVAYVPQNTAADGVPGSDSEIGLPPSPDAELVSFSCSVRCERETEEMLQQTEKIRVEFYRSRVAKMFPSLKADAHAAIATHAIEPNARNFLQVLDKLPGVREKLKETNIPAIYVYEVCADALKDAA